VTAAGCAVAIAAVLMAASACLSSPAVRADIGTGHLAPVVFWGLPLLAFVAAWLAPRLDAARGRRNASAANPFFSPALRLVPWMAAAFAADQSFLGIGHLLGWVTFTYGDFGIQGHPLRTVVLGLPACLLLGTLGVERALRVGILDGAATRWGVRRAALLSMAAGMSLAVPALLPGSFFEPRVLAAGLFVAFVREVGLILIYLRGGGLPLAGLGRGVLLFFEGRILCDADTLLLPFAQYTTSEPRFYLLRAATALVALAIVVAGCRRGAGSFGMSAAPER
jgi:hypothetical protein